MGDVETERYNTSMDTPPWWQPQFMPYIAALPRWQRYVVAITAVLIAIALAASLGSLDLSKAVLQQPPLFWLAALLTVFVRLIIFPIPKANQLSLGGALFRVGFVTL